MFISFGLGIITGKFLSLGFWPLVFMAVLFLFLVGLFYKKNKIILSDISFLLVFFVLGLICIKPYTVFIPEQIEGEEVTVLGQVCSAPQEVHNYKSYHIKNNYILSDDKKFHFPGLIKVKDYSVKNISFLDFYKIRGKIAQNFYSGKGYVLYVKKNNPPFLAEKKFDIRKFPYLVSERLSEMFKNNFSPSVSAFINSIFLGKRSALPTNIERIFIDGGSAHILAISGLHVGIISWIILMVLKIIGLKKRRRYITAAGLILFYAFICGLKTPVVRAAIMFFCFILSYILKRKFLVFNSLALAGLINLLFRPFDLFGVSFQFSFIAVFSILIGFRYIYTSGNFAGLLGKIKGLFLASLFVNIGLLPLISYYFGRIYIINLISNILLIPFLGLVLSSIFVFLCFYLIPFINSFIVHGCSFLIGLFLKLNYLFANFPIAYIEYSFSIKEVLLYYAVIIGLFFLIRGYKKVPTPVFGSGVRGFSRR